MTRFIRADTAINQHFQTLYYGYIATGAQRGETYGYIMSARDQFYRGFQIENSDENRDFMLSVHGSLVSLHQLQQREGGSRVTLQLVPVSQADRPINREIVYSVHTIPGHPNVLLRLLNSYGPESGDITSWITERFITRRMIGAEVSTAVSGTAVDPTGVVIRNIGVRVIAPENMDAIPAPIRPYVSHAVPAQQTGNIFEYTDGVSTLATGIGDDVTEAMRSLGYANLDAIITRARADYRTWLIARRANRIDEAAQALEQRRVQHARESARRFEAFRTTNMREDQLIPTLPFVPHGLAASRRWGIEVESGGARGVKAPEGWNRKRDGSLRSAWEGHTEVQDFEPYDEEVSETIEWYDCDNATSHVRYTERWNAETRSYDHIEAENFVEPADCDSCGEVTRTVHRVAQTITHSAQNDDCAEFVSPILTSMHSNGLEKLVAELAKQPQNDTAGVHVHVESNDLTDAQIATLVYGYDMIEKFVESSYQRGRRDYAQRQPSQRVLEAARALKSGKVTSNIRSADRYLTVNVQALRAHGTIEFRAMGPVYNYEHLIRWAMFCREMVNAVAGGATYKEFGRIKKWTDLLAIFAKYGKEYTRAAVYELTGETGEAAKLSKSGARVTASALNADLEAALLGLQAMRATASGAAAATDAFRALAVAYSGTVPNVTAIRRTVSPRLVSTADLVSI